MKKLIYLSLFIINFFVNNLYAAVIYLAEKNIITISGPIVSGDFQRLEKIARHIPYGEGILLLNSQGGVAYEGINMGEYVRRSGFSTAVLAGDECYSSCAIIWAAGTYKYAELPYSIIGFHAIYNAYTKNDVGYANAKLGAVLSRWGYSDNAIEFMTIAGANQISYLTFNNAAKLGIQYVDLAELNRYRSQTQYSLSPVDVVSGFYSALSRADGDLAAAYVIPEKRGIGPFNQINIYKFYSSLRKPLTIHSINQINSEQFTVNYSFTRKNNTHCNGQALVTVINYNGYYLIKSIKANC